MKKGFNINGVSLFASAGIGESFLENAGISILLANELLEKRVFLYKQLHPKSKMILGNITDKIIFNKILENIDFKVDFLLATPPCQGVSIAGKNRTINKMALDERNYLIYNVLSFIHKKKPDYILIENVPMFLKLFLPYKGEFLNIETILKKDLEKDYNIEIRVLDSADYGTPQKRKRAIIKICKKGLEWGWPKKEPLQTVESVIGFLPSLESTEKSNIKWHFARKHTNNHILWLSNTPTGKSAFDNKIHFPKKANGERIKGYESTYRRIKWNEPSPSITMRNDAISSQRNVHPGRKLQSGLYSDARVMSPLELMLLTGLPSNWNIPDGTPEILIRQCLGECVPPKLIESIALCIGKK